MPYRVKGGLYHGLIFTCVIFLYIYVVISYNEEYQEFLWTGSIFIGIENRNIYIILRCSSMCQRWQCCHLRRSRAGAPVTGAAAARTLGVKESDRDAGRIPPSRGISGIRKGSKRTRGALRTFPRRDRPHRPGGGRKGCSREPPICHLRVISSPRHLRTGCRHRHHGHGSSCPPHADAGRRPWCCLQLRFPQARKTRPSGWHLTISFNHLRIRTPKISALTLE